VAATDLAATAELRDLFRGRLLTTADDVEPFLVDWRAKWRGAAIAVAQPDTPEDVAAVVRWCAIRRIPVTPQGGNTGLSGGAVPMGLRPGVVVSLARLNRIREIDIDNNTMVVEAGCILKTVQGAARDAGRYFPLSLAAEGSCTIGGNLSTNAGGTSVLRYGSARDLCLGLEVVTPAGDLWHGLRKLRKDNTGYDLKSLFIGAEGTLGIITAAVLKLHAAPQVRAVAIAALPNVAASLELLRLLQSSLGFSLSACELFSDTCLRLVCEQFPDLQSPFETAAPWCVLVEATGLDPQSGVGDEIAAVLERAMESGIVLDAAIGTSGTQNDRLWALRENISEAQARHGKNVKHDVSVPISRIPEFVERAMSVLRATAIDVMPVVFGHLGDGNLHFNISAWGNDDVSLPEREASLNRTLHDLVHSFGGSISAEHGLGLLRRDEMVRYKSSVELTLMKSLKFALDPHELMNPGKVLL